MNSKYEWIYSFFLAIALTICFYIVVDITYDERTWEFSGFTLKARLLSIILTVATFFFGSYIYRCIAQFFIKKSKNKKRTNRKEYLLVLLINFVLINIVHIFGINYITQMHFRWRESILVNVVVTVLLFLYYMIIRNRILFDNFTEQNLQLEKVKVDQLETELKFLKSQYHPHFLFNALNTIYFQVDEKNEDAKKSIEQLSTLLRYQLYDIEQKVTMEQEINYMRSYIAFQQLRMSEKLVLNMYFDPNLKDQKIQPLLFQPLIENAFKYVRGEYRIELEMKLNGNQIWFEIKNSISQSQTNNKTEEGIGIENLKRRLNLLYPNKYTLEIMQTECIFVVKLVINTD